MKEHNVVALTGRDTIHDELTELIRDGARKLIAEGLETEVGELLAALSGRRDAAGRAAVVRNGYQPERAIQTGFGPVTVKVPKVRSRDGKPVSFRSALVPPYVRKSARRLDSGANSCMLGSKQRDLRKWMSERCKKYIRLLTVPVLNIKRSGVRPTGQLLCAQ